MEKQKVSIESLTDEELKKIGLSKKIIKELLAGWKNTVNYIINRTDIDNKSLRETIKFAIKQSKKGIEPKKVRMFNFQGEPGKAKNSDVMKISKKENLMIPLQVQLGRAKIKLQDIVSICQGTVIKSTKKAGEAIKLLAYGVPIAKGEIVIIDGNYGIRVTELLDGKS